MPGERQDEQRHHALRQLVGRVGEELRCVLTAGSDELGVTVTVTEVDGAPDGAGQYLDGEKIDIALYVAGVTSHGDATEPLPSVASEWSVNDDATEYTFDLRTDVTYSDGTPLTAGSWRAARTARGAFTSTGTRVSPRISPGGRVGSSDSGGNSFTFRV